MAEQSIIDIVEAEIKAREYLTWLLQRQRVREINPSEVTLEEFGLSKDSKSWIVTLGFPDLEASPAPGVEGEQPGFDRYVGRLPLRRYKRFKIDAQDGRLLSMKTR